MEKMFEEATRKKYRFQTQKGDIGVEEVWDLPLEARGGVDLDNLAIQLKRQIKALEEESYVKKTGTRVSKELETKFEIVKYIIDIKLKEAETRKQLADKKAHVDRLKALIADKQDEALKNKGLEELQKELEAELAALS